MSSLLRTCEFGLRTIQRPRATFRSPLCPPQCQGSLSSRPRGVPLSDSTAPVLILGSALPAPYTGLALVSPHTPLCCGTPSSFSRSLACPRQPPSPRLPSCPQRQAALRLQPHPLTARSRIIMLPALRIPTPRPA